MSKEKLIGLGAVFAAAVLMAETFEFDRTIEGRVALTSDQFSYSGGHLQAFAEEGALAQGMKLDYDWRFLDGEYDNVYDAIDRDKSSVSRVIPVKTEDGFYRVYLSSRSPDIEVGDTVRVSLFGSAWDHIQHVRASRANHPDYTPFVHAESFSVLENEIE